jgi:hypothetical protein
MGQLYPNPISSTQGLTINTAAPLTGGGSVPIGGSLTLGVNTSDGSRRNQFSVSPSPDGVVANFTVQGVSTSLVDGYKDVYVNGLLLDKLTYSVNGNVLSINTAPSGGSSIYVVFSDPVDFREQFTLSPAPDGTNTTFTFPSALPQGSYVDVFVNGSIRYVGVDYYLNIVNGAYSIEFTTAPAIGTSLTTVFDPSTNAGRGQYSLTPAADGVITDFDIQGGSPNTPYTDVYANGLWQAEGVDYSLSYESGKWKVSFTTAPVAATKLCAVFAPLYIVPASQSLPSVVNTLNGLDGDVTLVAGSNITITPSGNDLQIAATTSGGVTSLNTLTGALTLAAGSGITITPSGSTLTISSPGSAGYLKGTVSFNVTSTTGTFYASTNIPGVTPGMGVNIDVGGVLINGVFQVSFQFNVWASTINAGGFPSTDNVFACLSVSGLAGTGTFNCPVVVFP